MTDTKSIPDFPLFDVTDAEAAFGCDRSRYAFGHMSRDAAKSPSRELERQLREEARAGDALFFNGGRLTDHGFRVRPDMDSGKVHQALRGLMCSFAPSSEEKSATVALAIHHWCLPVAVEAPQTKES